jgi:predicted CXXCH cytochrome family protein
MIASRLVIALLALLSNQAPPAEYAPRNLDPGVAYVGDTVCAQCHSKEARTYRETAMGRSFARVSDLLADGALTLPAEGASFVHAKSNTRYRIFVEDGVLKHQEIRLDDQGRDVFTDTRPVIYALGSGDRARTFLLQQGDRLYQSPVAWRPHRDGWGMAAGYDVEKQIHFTRNVPGACLFCHANRAAFVDTTTNRYREPIFDGMAIGCERCHGPGALHVAERRNEPLAPEGNRPTIVNPAWLPADRRDGVCFQCHLQGDMRVVKAEHPLYAFRPGLALSDYFAVFHARRAASGDATGEGTAGTFKVVGHVERLRASKCWKESGGRIACLTCHDPHRTPRGEEAVEQFRAACLTCHKAEECGVDALKDKVQHPTGNLRDCAGCHMTKRPPSDAPHTVFTDHLIARTPAPPGPPAASDGEVVALVNFLEGERGNPRDAGVAGMHFARYEKDLGPMHTGAALLEPLAAKETHDVEALRLLAGYYEKQGRTQEARGVLETLVAHAPEKGEFKAALSQLYLSMGRFERAAALARQAVEEDPHLARARLALAESLAAAKDLAAAETQYRAALQADPALAPAYTGLGAIDLARDRVPAAETSFRAAVALDPGSRDARVGLARVFMSRADLPGALRELETGIASADTPEHAASLRFMLSAVLASAGRTQEAIAELETILAEFPHQPDALRLMQELRGRPTEGR